MGYRSWDASDYASYATTSAAFKAAPSTKHVFKALGMHPDLDPFSIQVRESRNSAANPQSTPLIFALDETGSMGHIAREIAQSGLGTLITETFSRKPVSDPHIMFMGIGDADYDQAPLQASQFETDITMIDQLTNIYIEGNGGGNGWESYNGAWHFAQFHTSCDAFEKDNRKGFLFTIGDEPAPPSLTEARLERMYRRGDEIVATNEQLLQMLASKYHIFHLIIEQGSHVRHMGIDSVLETWHPLLGERAIRVSDYTKLAEIAVSIMQVTNGADKAAVTKSWSSGTDLVVSHAIGNLTSALATTSNPGSTGIVRF